MAAQVGQESPLFFAFHTFGNHRQAHGTAQRNNGLCDGAARCVGQNVPDKRAVDFQLVQWKALEIGQRGVARSKVVQGDERRGAADGGAGAGERGGAGGARGEAAGNGAGAREAGGAAQEQAGAGGGGTGGGPGAQFQIGRASCRERVSI